MKAQLTILSTIALTVLAALPMRAQYMWFTILAGQTNAIGTNDGIGTTALFNHPHGLAVDSSGNVYVADTGNSSIRLITPDGLVSTPTLWTTLLPGQEQPPGAPAAYGTFTFQSPQQMVMDANTNLYVSDSINNAIFKVQQGNNWTVNLAAGLAYDPGASFENLRGLTFDQPAGLAVDTNGNLFVADTYNQVIEEVFPNGEVTTLAGQFGVHGTTNGAGTNAAFSFPYGLAIGQSNTLYETDLNYGIRQINSNVVSEFWHSTNYSTPHAIATDSAGNVYTVVAIPGNPQEAVIQITPQGTSNVVGVLPTTGTISAIAIDANTNIYLADQQNSVIIKSAPYPHFFDYQASLGSGVFYLAFAQGTNSMPFGYYNFNFPFPIFYHYDLGFERFLDANDGQNGGYLYDYLSSTWWYTSPQTFPYLYDFKLNTWLYYFPDTNSTDHYTSNPRYFFNFAQGTIITK